MQFYLMAPLLFFVGGGQTARRSLVIYVAVLVLLLALGASYPLINKGKYYASRYQFQFAVWPMMLGFCCEYGKRAFLRIPTWIAKFFVQAVFFVVGGMLLVMALGCGTKTAVVAAGSTLLLPCLLGYLFAIPLPGFLAKGLAWTGERTYSIYLWQEPLTIAGLVPELLQPVGALLSIPLGAVWFHWFEKPFLSSSAQTTTKSGKAVGPK